MNELDKEYCLDVINKHQEKPDYIKNMGLAFFFGGLISVFGQLLIFMFTNFGIDLKTSQTLMIMTVIFLTVIFTGFGIYDKFGQIAKAGAFVPISGFANAMTSSAIEYRSEGIVMGIATNLFKIAGAVITFGVVSAYIFSAIRYLLGLLI